MIIKNIKQITQFGFGLESKPITMYVGTIRAEDLIRKSEIFRRTPTRKEGYQREIQDSRLGTGKLGVAGYLLKQMGIFPTSILLNIRNNEGKVKFIEKESITEDFTIDLINAEINEKRETIPGIKLGDLDVPDNVTWYAIDGQHRLEGLKIAIKEYDELKDYPVIITMTNENIFYEMLIFYIVNGRAKSVSTDLAYRILQRMLYDSKAPKWIENEILTGSDRRKAVAATIVDYLNIKDSSPFKNRIQEVGEIKTDFHYTSDGTLTRYVAEVLRETIFASMLDEEVSDLLSIYWGAIEEEYPDCFKHHKQCVLLSTLGLSSLMRLFPVVYGYSAKDGNISKKNMRKYISYLKETVEGDYDLDFKRPITESWWHRVDGPGSIVKGTGEGHYKYVADQFAKKIGLRIQKK